MNYCMPRTAFGSTTLRPNIHPLTYPTTFTLSHQATKIDLYVGEDAKRSTIHKRSLLSGLEDDRDGKGKSFRGAKKSDEDMTASERTFRRLYRVSILVMIMAAVVGLYIHFRVATVETATKQLPLNDPIFLSLRNCDLKIHTIAHASAVGTHTLFIEREKEFGSSGDLPAGSGTANDPYTIREGSKLTTVPCTVDLYLNPAASPFPDLTVVSKNVLNPITSRIHTIRSFDKKPSYADLNFGPSKVNITGNGVDVLFPGTLIAGNLSVTLKEGSVRIPNFRVLPNAVTSLSSVRGDVFVGLNTTDSDVVLVDFLTGVGAACLLSPAYSNLDAQCDVQNATENGQTLSSSNSTANATDSEEFQLLTSCDGNVLLCESFGSCPSSVPSTAHKLTMKAVAGGIRAEVLNTFSDHIDIEGALAEYEVVASRQDRKELKDMREWFDSRPTMSSIAIIDVDTVTSGRFLVATSAPILQLDPWWMGAFSASLLQPRTKHFRLRFVSGQCISSLQDLDEDIFDVDYDDDTEESLLALITTMIEEFGSVGVTDIVAFKDKVPIQYTFDSSGHVLERSFKLTDNPHLMAAIGVSMFLATALAIVTLIAVWHIVLSVVKQQAAEENFTDVFEAAKGDLENKVVLTHAERKATKRKASEVEAKQSLVVPHPFRIPQWVYEWFRSKNASSLALYLREHGEAVFAQKQRMSVEDFSKGYEAYCTSKMLKEQNVADNPITLAVYGKVDLTTKKDSTTDIFRHLVFLDTQSVEKTKDERIGKNETSLSFFVRTRCKITPHKLDFVFVDEFVMRYHEFCRRVGQAMANEQAIGPQSESPEQHDDGDIYGLLKPIPVTSRVMERQFGVLKDRITVMFLVRTDATNTLPADSNSGSVVTNSTGGAPSSSQVAPEVSSDEANQDSTEPGALAKRKAAASEKATQAAQASRDAASKVIVQLRSFTAKIFSTEMPWWQADIILVLCHVFVCIIIWPALIVAVALYCEATAYSTTSSNPDAHLSSYDLQYRPWLIWDRMISREFLIPNLVVLWIAFAFYAAAIVELVLYYTTDPLTDPNVLRERRAGFFSRGLLGKLRWLEQSLVYSIYIMLVLSMIGYVYLGE